MRRKTSNRAQKRSARGSAAADAAPARASRGGTSAAPPIKDNELAELCAPLAPFALLILAVSGGADSVAMMHLIARWARAHPDPRRRIVVATVDHGLRARSRKEAEWVAGEAHAIGLAHEVLTWEGAKPRTGIQDAARQARYRLLAELGWRLGGSAPMAIVTAHTEDDQAETLLMRLARGSGLDGLTGMSASRIVDREAHGRLLRPLLGVSGVRLRATLKACGLDWLEDPSNACHAFERVRVRKARADLNAIGLTNAKIALSARRLERAREALEAAARTLEVDAALDLHEGAYASLEAGIFQAAPEDARLRVLSRLLSAFGGQHEPVRLAKLESLLTRLATATFAGATLGGALVARRASKLCVFREPGRTGLPEITLAPGDFAVWDRRFRLSVAPEVGGLIMVRALGASGYAQLRRQLKGVAGLPPARAAATLPAFWHGSTLLAVPPLAHHPGVAAAWGRKCGLCSAEFLW
jgi:tRNA(Ile)-lysidine synthase